MSFYGVRYMNTALAVESTENRFIVTSALEALQIQLISLIPITGSDIHKAVTTDIDAGRMLNQTVLLKLFSSPRVTLSTLDYQKLALLLREKLIRLPMNQADLFINYAQCAAACMKHSL